MYKYIVSLAGGNVKLLIEKVVDTENAQKQQYIDLSMVLKAIYRGTRGREEKRRKKGKKSS